MYPRMIGLCGSIGAGKDFVANYLVEKHGYDYLSWAEPLKEIAYYIYGPMGAERHHFWGTQEDKNEPLRGIRDKDRVPLTGRKILEHLGTEGFRGVDPNTWVNWSMAVKVRKTAIQGDDGTWFQTDTSGVVTPYNPKPTRWVIAGVRFPNEVGVVRSMSGIFVEVVRLNHESDRTGHDSDELWRALKKDFVLKAESGDLEGLKRRVDELFKEKS